MWVGVVYYYYYYLKDHVQIACIFKVSYNLDKFEKGITLITHTGWHNCEIKSIACDIQALMWNLFKYFYQSVKDVLIYLHADGKDTMKLYKNK